MTITFTGEELAEFVRRTLQEKFGEDFGGPVIDIKRTQDSFHHRETFEIKSMTFAMTMKETSDVSGV